MNQIVVAQLINYKLNVVVGTLALTENPALRKTYLYKKWEYLK